MMETTLNLHVDVLRKITLESKKRGISRSAMIIFLLKKSMEKISNPGRLGSLVHYQMRSMPEEWHAFHIKLRVDDYEFMLDLRKLLKMSVSLILARAAERFLQRSPQTITNYFKKYKADRNRFRNYVVIGEVVSHVVSWRFLWGFPPNIGKYLPINQKKSIPNSYVKVTE
jgi:hypothetical protein